MRATPQFDFQLGESAEMIREATARFADEQIAPLAEKIDREDWFPREKLWKQMGELGLHGITVDEADGGLGLGYLEHVIAVEEVSRASASLGLSYGAHSNLCINQIRRWGNEEQKAKYLVPLISGEPAPLSTASSNERVLGDGAWATINSRFVSGDPVMRPWSAVRRLPSNGYIYTGPHASRCGCGLLTLRRGQRGPTFSKFPRSATCRPLCSRLLH